MFHSGPGPGDAGIAVDQNRFGKALKCPPDLLELFGRKRRPLEVFDRNVDDLKSRVLIIFQEAVGELGTEDQLLVRKKAQDRFDSHAAKRPKPTVDLTLGRFSIHSAITRPATPSQEVLNDPFDHVKHPSSEDSARRVC
jgi:hypothetical protein